MPISDGNMEALERKASGLFADAPALGYVLVTLAALALGVAVTFLCIRIRKETDDKHRKKTL